MSRAMLPRVGVSACLLGERVRWDGDHRRHDFLVRGLGPHVEFVPLCPEAGIGLGVPREPIQLVRTGGGERLYSLRTRRDLTGRMNGWAAATLRGVGELDGFVLKSRSPSCGLAGARVSPSLEELAEDGPHERSGRGIFAAGLLRDRPGLPVVEETDLEAESARRDFVEKVFAAARRRGRPGGAPPDEALRAALAACADAAT